MNKRAILTINPGSTSTKIAVFHSNDVVFLKNIKHSAADLASFENIIDQFQFRKDVILEELCDAQYRYPQAAGHRWARRTC